MQKEEENDVNKKVEVIYVHNRAKCLSVILGKCAF